MPPNASPDSLRAVMHDSTLLGLVLSTPVPLIILIAVLQAVCASDITPTYGCRTLVQNIDCEVLSELISFTLRFNAGIFCCAFIGDTAPINPGILVTLPIVPSIELILF